MPFAQFSPETPSRRFRFTPFMPQSAMRYGSQFPPIFGPGTEFPVEMTPGAIAHLYWRPACLVLARLVVTTNLYGSISFEGPTPGPVRAGECLDLAYGIGAVISGTKKKNRADGEGSPGDEIVFSYAVTIYADFAADSQGYYLKQSVSVTAAGNFTDGYSANATSDRVNITEYVPAGAVDMCSTDQHEIKFPLFQRTPTDAAPLTINAQMVMSYAPWRFTD